MVATYQKPRVMPEEVNPAMMPLTVECPRCHAPHGVPCYGAAGQQRTASHTERWKAARRASRLRDTQKGEP